MATLSCLSMPLTRPLMSTYLFRPTHDQIVLHALQGACGALFSVVPFVSKRALGLVCGFVGAGGNTGSAITQVRTHTESMHQVLHADLPRGKLVGSSPQI